MNLEEMKAKKKEYGLTYEMIAERSEVPIGTVQKIFSGITRAPRYKTMCQLEEMFQEIERERRSMGPAMDSKSAAYDFFSEGNSNMLREMVFAYDPAPEASVPMKKRQGRYTVDDYNAIPDDRRVELIDGVIYDMTAPTKVHQLLIGQIYIQLVQFKKEHGKEECEVFLSPIDVQLDKDNRTMVQPDIVVICHEDKDERVIWGAPEFVLEVLSPSTRSKDSILKLIKYREAGCREYWIVDSKNQIVLVYTFQGVGEHELTRYSFDDKIPVAISDGELIVDFAEIKQQLSRYLT